MKEHDQWLKQQVDEAFDKAERGESVFFTQEEAEKKMYAFKKKIAEKHNS